MTTAARRESAIMIHGMGQARAALAAAAELDRPVTLISAPGAAGYAGAPWFLKVVALATADYPEARCDAILDCADKPGHVLAALRQGVKAVRFTGPKATAAKLSAIAEQSGACILTGRIEVFDLRGRADPRAACRVWLSGRSPGG